MNFESQFSGITVLFRTPSTGKLIFTSCALTLSAWMIFLIYFNDNNFLGGGAGLFWGGSFCTLKYPI